MKTFYVTVAANQPFGAGYFEVHAHSEEEAIAATNTALRHKWAFIYDSLDKVHEADRKKHGDIGHLGSARS